MTCSGSKSGLEVKQFVSTFKCIYSLVSRTISKMNEKDMKVAVAYAGFWKEGGARIFRKFERNIDQNLKLSHSNFVPFFAQTQVKSKKKVFTQISSHFSPNIRWFWAQSLMPNLQRGGACLNFAHFSMQFCIPGNPKGGAMAQYPPPTKYAPGK